MSKSLKFITCVIFHRIGQEILFDNMLDIEQSFLDYKNVILKNWKNWHFRKGANPRNNDFGQKFKIFRCVFFYRTCLYILFEKVLKKKQAFSELKTSFYKSRMICFFAKGLLLVKNLKFMACVIFHRMGQRIMFVNTLGIEKAFLNYKKLMLKN